VSYVPEDPLKMAPGVAEMMSDPAHYRRGEMGVVDYSKAPPEAGPPGWEPLLDFRCDPEPERSRWARAWAVLRGKAWVRATRSSNPAMLS
jgi:hypothetical protein